MFRSFLIVLVALLMSFAVFIQFSRHEISIALSYQCCLNRAVARRSTGPNYLAFSKDGLLGRYDVGKANRAEIALVYDVQSNLIQRFVSL